MDTSPFTYDSQLIDELKRTLDMRTPVGKAFDRAVEELAGNRAPEQPLVLDLATGAGKTYIIAGLVEYQRRQGAKNVVIVTPGAVVQDKTVANFTSGNPKFITGLTGDYEVITPERYDMWRPNPDIMQLFVLNVQQLIPPKETEGETKGGGNAANQRAARKPNESNGVVVEYLAAQDDLLVILDEQHLYSESAASFRKGIHDLRPAGIVGMTASPSDDDYVIFRYKLREAIRDKYVKRPVLAMRRNGYGERDRAEIQQLRDARAILSKKQQVYEAYWDACSDAPRVGPALFVQCADIDHATQTTELLRGPEFFGRVDAVLQIDSKNESPATLERLRSMDQPGSPVQCVVSVNKLKEGWDTHNIAVMVTLRAMASEVLTQQTLGRGLRLPFGKITGVPHIDQLDILAHDSFHSLLNSEGVLNAFGIDHLGRNDLEPAARNNSTTGDAPPHPGGEPHMDDAPSSVEAFETSGNPSSMPAGVAISGDGESYWTQDTGVGITVLDDDTDLSGFLKNETPLEVVTVRVNPRFAGTTFLFPATRMTREATPFSLTDVKDETLRNAARDTANPRAILKREEMEFLRDRIRTREADDLAVDDIERPAAEVEAILRDRLLRVSAVRQDEQNVARARRIAKNAVREAKLETWTGKSMASLQSLIVAVVEQTATQHARDAQIVTELVPRRLPVTESYPVPLGRRILERLAADSKGAGFKRGEHYGGWDRGLFEAAAFDSYSTEYRIASMANRSDRVRWWKRLYGSDNASIAYTPQNSYFPDFVVHDVDGVYWIIEGKSDQGKDDSIVRAKADAAESAIHKIEADARFDGTEWRYLIAFESDVRAAESWEDLSSGPRVVRG